MRAIARRGFVIDDIEVLVPQLPTTLPTLDELIGREDLQHVDPVDHLLALTAAEPLATMFLHCMRSLKAASIYPRSTGYCAAGANAA